VLPVASVVRVADRARPGSVVRRTVPAYLVATVGALAVAVLMLPWRADLSHTIVAFAFLVPVIAASWLGGVVPGIVAAVVASALFNALFLPPYGTFDLERTEYVVVFFGFLATSLLISWLVGVARDRAAAAEEREAEVRLLFDLSHILVTERSEGLGGALGAVAERLGYVLATLLPAEPAPTELAFPLRVGEELVGSLVFVGDREPLSPAETRVVRTFADEVALVVQAERLQSELREAEDYRRTEDVRQAMLAAASHELKSPVAAITASVTDVLSRDRFDEAVAREVLEDVRASTGRLEQLITNLLDMSRIESGTLVAHDEVVALDEVVTRAVDGVRERWPGVAIEVAIAPDAAAVRGDQVFVDRIVTNLVENAARAVRSAADRRIQVAARRVGTEVQVAVVDHGPGLAFGDQERLFTPFYRLREGSPRLSAGLGLAICKGFVTAMGGEIEASDTPGGGTTIAFRLGGAG
jgi:two-component system sensor histidine kinase KdpD